MRRMLKLECSPAPIVRRPCILRLWSVPVSSIPGDGGGGGGKLPQHLGQEEEERPGKQRSVPKSDVSANCFLRGLFGASLLSPVVLSISQAEERTHCWCPTTR